MPRIASGVSRPTASKGKPDFEGDAADLVDDGQRGAAQADALDLESAGGVGGRKSVDPVAAVATVTR
jgi:hypothetical protein